MSITKELVFGEENMLSCESLTTQDINIEIKKLIDDIDNISSNIDLYKVIVDEKLLVAS
ncbi:TPA: hypothetical protein IAA87_09855 [Candidatus Avigastranaerophilus faecigallinarum]|nr:hypothetical protein [Candidatus Avigastranaerophilus faecigallinarum]